MLKISTKEDLQRLVDDEIQESLTLDYKASPALARDDKQRDELCKDCLPSQILRAGRSSTASRKRTGSRSK